MIETCTTSKSCQLRIQVVSAIPAPANAYPISTETGSASTAHQEPIRPIASITTTNIAEYAAPRSSAQVTSPVATSHGRSGVASTASYSLAYFILKKMLYVESKTAPFIAEDASMAGATNSV